MALKSTRGSLKSVSTHLGGNRRWVPLFSAASPSKQISSHNILKWADKFVSSTRLKNAARQVWYSFLLLGNFRIRILSSCLFVSTMWPSLPWPPYNVPPLLMLLEFPSLPLLLLCDKKPSSLCLVIARSRIIVSASSLSEAGSHSCWLFSPHKVWNESNSSNNSSCRLSTVVDRHAPLKSGFWMKFSQRSKSAIDSRKSSKRGESNLQLHKDSMRLAQEEDNRL